MDDATLVAQRRIADDQKFLTASLDPEMAPRIAPAMNALRSLLGKGWHSHEATLAAMLRVSDIAVKTAEGLLARSVRAGFVEKRGEFTWRPHRTDTRTYHLINWPSS